VEIWERNIGWELRIRGSGFGGGINYGGISPVAMENTRRIEPFPPYFVGMVSQVTRWLSCIR
jgi:hypothetical protein